MKILTSFLVILLAAALAASAGTPSKDTPVISIVSAPEMTNLPDTRKAGLAFDLAHRALGHVERANPRVVLMYVSEQTARAHGLPKDANVMVVHVATPKSVNYYVWVVGEATDERLAVAAVMVLNREWELKLSKKEIDAAAHKVRLGLSGVVSAQELAKEASR